MMRQVMRQLPRYCKRRFVRAHRLRRAQCRLYQYAPVLAHEYVDLMLNHRGYHRCGLSALGAGKSRSGAEQPTNQRPVVINTAAIDGQVRTIPTFRCAVARRFTQSRQVCDFSGRGHDRTTAIVATWNTGKFRNVLPEEHDLLSVLHQAHLV